MSRTSRDINVGLIGLGTVGTGVARILIEQGDQIRNRLGMNLKLKAIADLDVSHDRGLKLPPGLLSRDVSTILDDPDIDVVVELIGGMDAAKRFILKALEAGKHVVTANKALLAEDGKPLFEAAAKYGKDLLFEAGVAGGIPIIRTLKEGLAANRILQIQGILNGTCNYILTKMTEEGSEFETVLAEAQKLGYAEADPTFDVDGHDTAHKVAILTALSFGVDVDFSRLYVEGIRHITPLDIQLAREFGYRIKLLGMCRCEGDDIEARVHPTMIPESHMLANVGLAYNALLVEGDAVGNIMLYGAGAGEMPTASAVVADIMELARNIRHNVSGRVPCLAFQQSSLQERPIKPMDDVESRYYFRFSALDRPGVLSRISGILGNRRISIASVIQKARRYRGAVPIVTLTHRALERNVRAALAEIDQLEEVQNKTMMIRVEDEDEPVESES